VKKLSSYKAWVLDFDGTLYRQPPVQIFMAIWLVVHYFFRPMRLNELFILRDWRRLREKRFCADEKNFRELQLAELERRYKVPVNAIEKILRRWLIERPLKILRFAVRKKFLVVAKHYQSHGVKMIVYSDNPVREKLSAIDFFPDENFCADDEFICCMKPDAQGLKNILTTLKLKPDEVLYIGDRDDRDGLCARQAGVDYVDVKAFEKIEVLP